MPSWSADDIPDLQGRTALVTGATSGIGYHAAAALAAHGARVLLGCRDAARGTVALQRMTEARPDSVAEVVTFDLADLDSVKAAAREVADRTASLDILINSAGVILPAVLRTADGFERQYGINHLGHFALTARLLPVLLASPEARVVSLSSIAHRASDADFGDPRDISGSRWHAYRRSKLANLVFARELDRRCKLARLPLKGIAVHPGPSTSDLLSNSALASAGAGAGVRLLTLLGRLIGQGPGVGALPALYAASAPSVRGGEYFGPRGPGELRGGPAPARLGRAARDPRVAARLWETSAAATGVGFETLDVLAT
jgi:NAD(P)-dependent dehydrogenase (short-subunit alcohol dehydrogenase family)